MQSLRHASRLVTLIGLALACATANAALIVNVEGVRGSGKTTWTLSGSSTTTGTGTVGTSTDTGSKWSGGYTRFSNGVKFLSAGNERQQRFRRTRWSPLAVTGSPKLTVGSEERTITHLTLSPFGGAPGADGDFLWFRVDSELSYLGNSSSSWSGSFTLDLDISDFKIGTYTENDPSNSFFASDLTLIFKETTPQPSSLALLGLALTGLGFSRKRKGATSTA